MPKFIELTMSEDSVSVSEPCKFTVNSERIVVFEPFRITESRVCVNNGDVFYVKESYEQVQELLKDDLLVELPDRPSNCCTGVTQEFPEPDLTGYGARTMSPEEFQRLTYAEAHSFSPNHSFPVWEPIRTALSGIPILVCKLFSPFDSSGYYAPQTAKLEGDLWTDAAGEELGYSPTHWMLLPSPPSEIKLKQFVGQH